MQYGLMSAAISLLIFVVLYLLGSESFKSPFAFATILIPFVFAVIACRKAKKDNEGFLEFKEALKICFGILVLNSLVTSLFSYILYNFIDKPFADSMKQLTIEQTQKFMSRFGVPQDQIDKAVNGIIEKDLYTFGTIMFSFVQGCIVWFILALIMAAILKKKKPVFGE
jgi:predicted permease